MQEILAGISAIGVIEGAIFVCINSLYVALSSTSEFFLFKLTVLSNFYQNFLKTMTVINIVSIIYFVLVTSCDAYLVTLLALQILHYEGCSRYIQNIKGRF